MDLECLCPSVCLAQMQGFIHKVNIAPFCTVTSIKQHVTDDYMSIDLMQIYR